MRKFLIKIYLNEFPLEEFHIKKSFLFKPLCYHKCTQKHLPVADTSLLSTIYTYAAIYFARKSKNYNVAGSVIRFCMKIIHRNKIFDINFKNFRFFL